MRNSFKVTRTSIITMLVCASIGLSWQFIATSAQDDGKKPSANATTTVDNKEAFFKQIDEICKLPKFTDDGISKILGIPLKFFGHGMEPCYSEPEERTATVERAKIAHNREGEALLLEMYVADKLIITEDDIVKRYGPGEVKAERPCGEILEERYGYKTETLHTYRKENNIVLEFQVIKKPQERVYMVAVAPDDDSKLHGMR